MKNIKKRFAVAVGVILATFLLLIQVTFATQTNEMGCISKEPGAAKLKFFGGDFPDKKAIGETVVNARSHGTKVIDPCLTGQVRNIPASVYTALAEKHPEKLQPLESKNQSVISLTKKDRSSGSHKVPEYRYVGINEAVPPGFLFDAFSTIGITHNSRVYSSVFNESEESPYVAVFKRETITILEKSKGIFATAISRDGMVGGFILTDPENFITQAALFDGKEIIVIPPIPESIFSSVIAVNDRNQALIESFVLVGEEILSTLALYDRGRVTPLDFGPDIPFAFFLGMNNKGIISGTTSIEGVGDRGFRFDLRTNVATLLEPLPTEPHAWALDINERGDILGYSFEFGATERIGVWDKEGKFHTYFVEGTPEFPTISNDLKFNDHNLIVITQVTSPLSEQGNSYLVPKPGVRLNLDDLVTQTPSPLINDSNFWRILGISNHGDMFGRNFFGGNPAVAFFLERL